MHRPPLQSQQDPSAPVSHLSNAAVNHQMLPILPLIQPVDQSLATKNSSRSVRNHLNMQKNHQDEQISDLSGNINVFETSGRTRKERTGFNHRDFEDSDDENFTQVPPRSASSQSLSSYQHLPIATREIVYRIIDSIPAAIFFIMLSLIDYCTASASILTQSHVYLRFYRVLDWITAIAFFLDVNARLYSYGFWFYIHGLVRSFEYVLSLVNFIFVAAYVLTGAHWLLITRYIRLFRMLTTSLRLRDRHLKWRTRLELESLAQVLETERSEHSKLTKWRIYSNAIAIGERAGQGGFGTVYSGLFRGTLVAVKQISPSEQHTTVSCIEDEAITLVNLRHPNVVLFMGFVNETSKLWIVTEYCSRGSVRDRLDAGDAALTEGRILKLALGAARGLAYLHGQQPPVLHLDLKTSNILISSGWDAKLGDFGLSKSIDNIENNWFYGTMQYAAPEILEANKFTTAADVYSFGICLWEMATKEIPYEHMDPAAVLWGVVKSNLRPPLEKLVCSSTATMGGEKESTSMPPANILPENRTVCVPASPAFVKRGSCGASTISPSSFSGIRQLPSGNRVSQTTSYKNQTRTVIPISVQETMVTARVSPMANRHVPVSLVPPFHFKQEFQEVERSKEDREMMLSSETFAEISEEVDSTVKKWSNRRRIQKGARGEPNSVGLNNLSTKVTATIQMFDDRPPIIRRKDDEGSVDASLEAVGSGGDASSVPGSPRFPSMMRQNIIPKSIGRAYHRKTFSQNANVGNNPSTHSEEDSDPFMRRLANFSKRTDNANKFKVGKAGVRSGVFKKETFDEQKDSAGCRAAKVPQEYIDLIQKCWAQNADERPTASELVWQLVIMMDCQMREK
ncbi:unnamed protein product [Agarophyton chilense]